LRAAKIEAERASKAKDDFLALLSHELRTPLTPALAAASYLAEHEDLLPEFRKEINAVLRNVQLEARLIDDLLDVTRIARGKIQLCREVVDAHALVQDALEVARKNMREKKIELSLRTDAVEHHVRVDPVRIRQVLWNLINNAVKFSDPGARIEVRTKNIGRSLVFEISDSGIGIEPEKKVNIFKAFEQGEASITRQFGGLGLGLTISKTLVDLHGGTIKVHSDGKNRGATFRVALQAVAAPATRKTASNGGDPGLSRSLQVSFLDC
jgi:signal transduction histidine kinase